MGLLINMYFDFSNASFCTKNINAKMHVKIQTKPLLKNLYTLNLKIKNTKSVYVNRLP